MAAEGRNHQAAEAAEFVAGTVVVVEAVEAAEAAEACLLLAEAKLMEEGPEVEGAC